MATAPMSFVGGSTLTGHLLIVARKTTTPLVIEDTLSFPPPISEPLNTYFDNLDPVPHIIEFRNSPDGAALGVLLTTFLYDVKNQRPMWERRFYRVGGLRDIDPAPNQTELADPYLDGKNIGGVFKEGFRYLIDGEEINPKAGGGISLQGGLLWGEGEVVSIEIDYMADVPSDSNNFEAPGYKLITSNTTLDNTYRNAEIDLESESTRLVVTLEIISEIPDGTRYKFTHTGGPLIQGKIITQSGNLIRFNNKDVNFIALGRNESATIVKRGSKFKVIDASPGLSMVGERFAGTWINHPNTLPEDDRVVNGDDFPRFYEWIITDLPFEFKAYTTDALLDTYVRSEGLEAVFLVTTDSRRFRMPNTQGWSERGLKDFDTYGPTADTTRTYNYPGGTQPSQVGPHWHKVATQVNSNENGGQEDPEYNQSNADHNVRYWQSGNARYPNQKATTGTNKMPNKIDNTTENIVKNIGVIYLRRT